MVQAEAFRAKLVLEEGERRIGYQVDFKEGAFRIEPEGEGVYLIVDVEQSAVTLVRKEDKVYCRLSYEEFRKGMDAGIVQLDWFPWVYRVGPDLVENLEIRELGDVVLPDGRQGRRVSAYSESYERNLAEYWLDPTRPSSVFLQWCDVYEELWGSDDVESQRSLEKRLAVYKNLKELPVNMEERFTFLTRPRILRLEDRQPMPDDAFALPDELKEKTLAELMWEDVARKLEKWFRPKK
jgi:hypothetical protein